MLQREVIRGLAAGLLGCWVGGCEHSHQKNAENNPLIANGCDEEASYTSNPTLMNPRQGYKSQRGYCDIQ